MLKHFFFFGPIKCPNCDAFVGSKKWHCPYCSASLADAPWRTQGSSVIRAIFGIIVLAAVAMRALKPEWYDAIARVFADQSVTGQ